MSWQTKETAIIICDMWDKHWCKGATQRVGVIAKKMNRVVGEARRQGVLIVHAPSDTLDFYKNAPQRLMAINAPKAGNIPEGIDRWCSLEPGREGSLPIDDSDGGCDCAPQCKGYKAWKRQIASIDIAAEDAISDRGSEIWNLFEQKGIKNVVLMGVHTNMCVLGRPFGIRSMAKIGKNVVLARDLTDTMYNSRMPPFVDHRRGTELVLDHIEKNWCPTVLSSDLVGTPTKPHVVFVIAEKEYKTKTTLPAFAKEILEPNLGIRSTFCHVSDDDPWNIPGLEALDSADLMVLSIRRRALPKAQMDRIRSYVESGRPVVAIRTSSHAFDTRGAAAKRKGYEDWPEFDAKVLGGNYQGHHNNKTDGKRTFVWKLEERAKHPILSGVAEGELQVRSWLYRAAPLGPKTTTLMLGRVEGRKPYQPVAWTNTYRGGRIFYTSLGHVDDFASASFQRLLSNAVSWAMEREVVAK